MDAKSTVSLLHRWIGTSGMRAAPRPSRDPSCNRAEPSCTLCGNGGGGPVHARRTGQVCGDAMAGVAVARGDERCCVRALDASGHDDRARKPRVGRRGRALRRARDGCARSCWASRRHGRRPDRGKSQENIGCLAARARAGRQGEQGRVHSESEGGSTAIARAGPQREQGRVHSESKGGLTARAWAGPQRERGRLNSESMGGSTARTGAGGRGVGRGDAQCWGAR